MSAGPADPNAVYPLGRSPEESERLGRQSDDLVFLVWGRKPA